jgi:hypothetical protein
MICDLPERIPCPDGTCIGTLNGEGRCNACGMLKGVGEPSKDQRRDWEWRDRRDAENSISFGVKRQIMYVLAIFSLFSWLLFIFVYWFYYQDISPASANVATGHIYEVNNHGYVFYITKKQMILAYIPCFVAGVGSSWEPFWKDVGRFLKRFMVMFLGITRIEPPSPN